MLTFNLWQCRKKYFCLLRIWMDRSFRYIYLVYLELFSSLLDFMPQVVTLCTWILVCASRGTGWGVPIVLKNSLPHCGNMIELQYRSLKQIKCNKKSSIRLVGEQVLSIRRWGPRGPVEPTPLFFTPPRNIWWGLEIWHVHQP